MIYEWECQRCFDIYEEYRPFDRRNEDSICPYCLADGHYGKGMRLICSNPQVAKDRLHHFIDVNTTGRPIEFTSKQQWQKHLKSLGMNDDVPQRALKDHEVKDMTVSKSFNKEKNREEIKKAIVADLSSKGKIRA